MQQERERFWQMDMSKPLKAIPNQTLADVIGNWPQGEIPVRCSDYMARPHQRWTLTPVEEAGGYLSNPYFKITIADTDRALAATAEKELTTVPAFTYFRSTINRIRIIRKTVGPTRFLLARMASI